MANISDHELVTRAIALADMSDMDEEDRETYVVFVAAACNTKERKQLIKDYLQRDDISFQSLIDYVSSIVHRVVIVDDDELDEDEDDEFEESETVKAINDLARSIYHSSVEAVDDGRLDEDKGDDAATGD